MSRSSRPLRLMIYDRTCRGRIGGLSTVWQVGGWLYRARSLLDARRGVASWAEALDWLGRVEPGREISEIQLWSHGKWGDARIGSERFAEESLRRGGEWALTLDQLRRRLSPDALFWFRTCETFGAHRGRDFARSLSDRLGCRVAGHTYVIDLWQSGLHQLRPGKAPDWSPDEGLRRGNAHAPVEALRSGPAEPRTISCFEGKLPDWA